MGNSVSNDGDVNESKQKIQKPSVNDIPLEIRAINLGPLQILPADCMVRIASRLPVRDILNFCTTTSYVTHVLLNSRNLWNFLLQRDFTQQMQLDENVLTIENNYDAYVECQEMCLRRVLEAIQDFEVRCHGAGYISNASAEQFRTFFPPVYGQVPKLEAIEAACRHPNTNLDCRYINYLLSDLAPSFVEQLQDLIRQLEFEVYHKMISAKSFSNKLSVSKRNTAKDVSDPMKKYIRIWVLVHSSALYAGWEQNTKKGQHEAEVYIMNNRQIFEAQKKQKGWMDNGRLIRAPEVIPVLLVGLPGAGIDSFVEYLKLQQMRRGTTLPDQPMGSRSLRELHKDTCCTILVDSGHMVSFTRIPYTDLRKQEEELVQLEEDCDKFFATTEGNGTLGILVDGAQPETETFAFLDQLFETMTSVNVFRYRLAVMLLVHKADKDNVLPLNIFQQYLEKKIASKKLNYVILYTSIYITGTIDVAAKWLVEYGPKFDSSYIRVNACTLF